MIPAREPVGPGDPIPFIGAFESTYQPEHDRDVIETTQHDVRWRDDLRLMAASGVERLRYPIRWHRVERDPGVFDWRQTDEVLGAMCDLGLDPIVDLLHHTSYPRWLGDLSSRRLQPAFMRFVEQVAMRYPWLRAYTVCNEPLTTLLLCGMLGVWPPHGDSLKSFVDLASNVVPAVNGASRALGELLPEAEHFHVEVCERHTWTAAGERTAASANDRRFLFIDLLIGRTIEPHRPFVEEVVRAGGEDLLCSTPGRLDVLGLDYYAHNQWHWHGDGQGTNVAPSPEPLSELLIEYADRYRVPIALGETNIRGFAADRATWMKYTLEQCERTRDRGVDVRGYCWFPFVDSADWSSLLRSCEGAIDPVGVYWLDEHLERRASVMSTAFAAAARGTRADDLPAYELRPPVSEWLRGWLPHMAHWSWQHPPPAPCSNADPPETVLELRKLDVA
jgi:beta-glucosidase/6-phospho-beta-glucosidase/beta-galactosidase